MLGKIILILFYLLFPVLVIVGISKNGIVKKIGAIVICYAVGLIIGNIGILPDDIYNLQDTLTSITIPLAIPLLLFSENIRKWLGMARTTAISLILGLISVVIMVALGNYIFSDIIPDSWKVSSMLIGVYSGGTPNLAAISEMLDVNEETYILTHTIDLVIGAFLLLFLLTVGQKFFLLFLRNFNDSDTNGQNEAALKRAEEFESYDGILSRNNLKPLFTALGISVLIVGISVGLMSLVKEESKMIVVILSITTLGILASLVPRINALPKTFPLGMYFILVFSLVVASMADLSEMFGQGQSIVLLSLFLFVLLAVIGSLLLHAIFSWIFRIDADHFIITSVALSMSPPFVPVVAAALKNRAVVLPGLILGIIGYAMGNYLGYLMSVILK